MKNAYAKFVLMMCCSFITMYAAMFFNVDLAEHIMLSNTRTYMTLLMITPMAVIMLLFMWKMYEDKRLNYLILSVSILVFIACFGFLRGQAFIKDVDYMKAMIPHHSSAIMVSQQAHLQDPETKELARQIIKSQQEEIAQMKRIIKRLEENK